MTRVWLSGQNIKQPDKNFQETFYEKKFPYLHSLKEYLNVLRFEHYKHELFIWLILNQNFSFELSSEFYIVSKWHIIAIMESTWSTRLSNLTWDIWQPRQGFYISLLTLLILLVCLLIFVGGNLMCEKNNHTYPQTLRYFFPFVHLSFIIYLLTSIIIISVSKKDLAINISFS